LEISEPLEFFEKFKMPPRQASKPLNPDMYDIRYGGIDTHGETGTPLGQHEKKQD
jgi:hypothetical protein